MKNKMNKIELTKTYAEVRGALSLCYKNNKKQGYPLSKKAKKEFEKHKYYPEIYSVEYEGQIIWVSTQEFKENNFKEISVPSGENK